jgi:hypothetical protein
MDPSTPHEIWARLHIKDFEDAVERRKKKDERRFCFEKTGKKREKKGFA